MPRRDGGPSDEVTQEYANKIEKLEAMLCAVSTLLDNEEKIIPLAYAYAHSVGMSFLPVVLDNIDWKAAGVTKKEFKLWWEKHQDKDERKRVLNDRVKKEKLARKKALKKLTSEERAILGLGDA